eukprot:TRINITY_DN2341_c0_g1_i3.p2 TRINITY_DN2341_c0_g1~~TRINITY_DN2341_c0_g1_i3.p2  ORF type:complete len:111 (+),score=7.39 TRINITY_DN2341_c0_g1_i3:222-554(+)
MKVVCKPAVRAWLTLVIRKKKGGKMSQKRARRQPSVQGAHFRRDGDDTVGFDEDESAFHSSAYEAPQRCQYSCDGTAAMLWLVLTWVYVVLDLMKININLTQVDWAKTVA